ncbi:MAG: phytoene desaturase [Paracoccaceae bacterium]|nr:phytoene desaturase [Paracoccaceae bacterium]
MIAAGTASAPAAGPPHFVVVGAGIGGLVAALLLAQAGLAVTVVERQPTPGGKMRALASEAGPVDAGPTVLTLRTVFDEIFAAADARLADHVTLVAEAVLARHFWPDGSQLDLFADADASAAAIAALAGAREAEAFRRFDRQMHDLFAAFDGPMMRTAAPDPAALARLVAQRPGLLRAMAPGLTLARSLALRFRDPRLRQLFGRYATYVGGMPGQVPALLGLVWRAEAAGVWRVEGGMHRLALALARLAERRGVRFLYGAEVRQIDIQSGRVAGVQIAGGPRIRASAVVFNGDPAALRAGLLGPAVARAVPEAGVRPRSLSARVWAFAAATRGPDLAHHNVFFARDPRAEFADIARGRMPRDPTIYLCAQDRGTGRDSPIGAERFELILNAAPLGPGPDDGDDATCHRLTFETLGRFGLRFSDLPPQTALTTPEGFATLFPGSDGALYGRSPQGLMAALRRPRARTEVPGLYLCGGGAHPGAGVPMAALSGRHAAAMMIADLASTSAFRPAAMPGGISTASLTMAADRSLSSPLSEPSSRPGMPGRGAAIPPTTSV